MKRIAALFGCAFLSAYGGAVRHASAGPPLPATDAEIAAMIAAAGDSDDYKGKNFVYVLDEADVYVQDSGLATTVSCEVVKLLTAAGVKSRAALTFGFDPATNRVTVTRVRIHRADGTVEAVDLGSLVTQPAPQHSIYWGNMQHVLDVPRMEVGDTLEVRTSKIGFNIAYLAGEGQSGADGETLVPPMPGHWYEVTRFQGDHPIIKKRYSVHMPKDKPVQYEVYNGKVNSALWFHDDAHVYSFWDDNIPAVKREPHMVGFDDCVPKVVMATVGDWEAKSRWFHGANDDQFDADTAIRAKVAALTEHLTDENEKIMACSHWVADNVRYYGTSRGPCEGFTLHQSTETFRDLGGVCKDKAGMLVTMLRVLGHDSIPVLTMAGSRVEAIPADQFNHTVTAIRNGDGTFTILDPTWTPLSMEWWSSREALQHIVYGTPEGQGLDKTPYYSPEYNTMKVRALSALDEAGGLSTDIEMDLSGYACTYLRRSVYRHRADEQRAAFEQAMGIAPGAVLMALAFTDPHDYSTSSKVRMSIAAAGYAAGDGDLRMFRLPLMSRPLASFMLPDLDYSVEAASRTYGMRMRATRLVSFEETIDLPAGWSVDRLPDPVELDSGSASLSFSAEADGTRVSYRFELRVKNHQIPPGDYPGFKKAIEAMKGLADAWIVCDSGATDTR